MKRKVLYAGVGAVLVAVALIGGTMAANNAKTSSAASANISVNKLSDTIDVKGTDNVFDKNKGLKVIPGGDYTISRKVRNAGKEGDYDSYVKAVIYKSWKDNKGEYIDTSKTDVIEDQAFVSTDSKKTAWNDVKEGETHDGWLVGHVDDEQIVLYYVKPLPVGESTTPFIDGISFDSNLNNAYANASYDVEFEVTSVQKYGDSDAIASAFGVMPAFDKNGNITSVSEDW